MNNTTFKVSMDCDDIKKPVEVRLDFLYFIVLLQYL
jgi:hypothetical protein